MKKIFLTFCLAVALTGLLASPGLCQNSGQLLGQVAQVYAGNTFSNGLIGGFSLWGLMGGIVFGSIGFIAFMYGKKNSELKPVIIGIALMAYPYFLKGTIPLYVVGIILTAALYFFRD